MEGGGWCSLCSLGGDKRSISSNMNLQLLSWTVAFFCQVSSWLMDNDSVAVLSSASQLLVKAFMSDPQVCLDQEPERSTSWRSDSVNDR